MACLRRFIGYVNFNLKHKKCSWLHSPQLWLFGLGHTLTAVSVLSYSQLGMHLSLASSHSSATRSEYIGWISNLVAATCTFPSHLLLAPYFYNNLLLLSQDFIVAIFALLFFGISSLICIISLIDGIGYRITIIFTYLFATVFIFNTNLINVEKIRYSALYPELHLDISSFSYTARFPMVNSAIFHPWFVKSNNHLINSIQIKQLIEGDKIITMDLPGPAGSPNSNPQQPGWRPPAWIASTNLLTFTCSIANFKITPWQMPLCLSNVRPEFHPIFLPWYSFPISQSQ